MPGFEDTGEGRFTEAGASSEKSLRGADKSEGAIAAEVGGTAFDRKPAPADRPPAVEPPVVEVAFTSEPEGLRPVAAPTATRVSVERQAATQESRHEPQPHALPPLQPVGANIPRQERAKPELSKPVQADPPKPHPQTTRRTAGLPPPLPVSAAVNAVRPSADPPPGGIEPPPALQGFASFAKIAAAGQRQMPKSNALPEQPQVLFEQPQGPFEKSRSLPEARSFPQPDRPPIAEAVRNAAPERNTIHIGRVDIQILPPPERAKPVARPAQNAPVAILSRGFTSWFGLRQG
jgi:hypothetical protein